MIAVGGRADGKREVLGVSVELSENEVHSRNFIKSLISRGLHGVKLVISDAHEGLKAALRAVFPSILWQRVLISFATKCAELYSYSGYEKRGSFEEKLPEGFTVFGFLEEHRRRVSTSNVLERPNKEVNRRTRVVGIFPNAESCLRLVIAVLMEISKECEQGRVYLEMNE